MVPRFPCEPCRPLLAAYAPFTWLDVVHNVLALWSFALLLAVLGTLLWFFYWFFLRRFLRARHIANLRLKRMMQERERDSGSN